MLMCNGDYFPQHCGSSYPLHSPSALQTRPLIPRSFNPTQVLELGPYYQSTNALYVNMSQGGCIVQACGVFIRNLSHRIDPLNLVELFRSAGLLPIDHQLVRNRNSKVYVTAKFKSEDEAKLAVKVLHNMMHMGRILNVRLDSNVTAIEAVQQPLIVNGTSSR